MEKKWKHKATLVYVKHKVKVVCCCGKQSPFFTDDDADTKEAYALSWHVIHTKLVEKGPRRKGEDE